MPPHAYATSRHPRLVPLTRQTTVRAPPKAVFPFLHDVTLLEDITPWRVTPLGDEVGVGFQWRESRPLRRRTWTVTAFDRRGLSFTAESGSLRMTLAARKGGTGSTNVRMVVDGDEGAVRRFGKTDGDRLERLRAFLED